jgi:hypothetical protein
MEGDLHFRRTGRVIPAGVARPHHGGRVLLGHAVRWRAVERVHLRNGDTIDEWFSPGSLIPEPGGVPLVLQHGGKGVGRLVKLIDGPIWCDVACLVNDGAMGDGLLDLVAKHDRLPLSIGFRTNSDGYVMRASIHDDGIPGVERIRCSLYEIAVTHEGAHSGAYVYATGRLEEMTDAAGC